MWASGIENIPSKQMCARHQNKWHQHMTPNQVNRTLLFHQEKCKKDTCVFVSCRPMENRLEIAKTSQEFLFLLIRTLRTFWAERIFILIFYVFDFSGFQISSFLDFQMSRFKAVSWHVLWPTGLRSHLDQKILSFYHKYWCLSSRPTIWPHRREGASRRMR